MKPGVFPASSGEVTIECLIKVLHENGIPEHVLIVARVACPWLIKRFVDSDAEFMFVPSNQIAQVAERENAIPFDAPGSGAKLGHRNGNCTFVAIIEDYGLTDKALLELAKIVRAVDTNNFADHSVAAGLQAG